MTSVTVTKLARGTLLCNTPILHAFVSDSLSSRSGVARLVPKRRISRPGCEGHGPTKSNLDFGELVLDPNRNSWFRLTSSSCYKSEQIRELRTNGRCLCFSSASAYRLNHRSRLMFGLSSDPIWTLNLPFLLKFSFSYVQV